MNSSIHPAYGLLLLPPPPYPATVSTLAAAFERPLRHVMTTLSLQAHGATLDVVLLFWVDKSANRNEEFPKVAILVTGVYALLSSIYKDESVPEYGIGSVNVRLLLIRYDPLTREVSPIEHYRRSFDIVVDPRLLVRCKRLCNRLFVVEGEEGERIYRQFRAIVFEGLSLTSAKDLRQDPRGFQEE